MSSTLREKVYFVKGAAIGLGVGLLVGAGAIMHTTSESNKQNYTPKQGIVKDVPTYEASEIPNKNLRE